MSLKNILVLLLLIIAIIMIVLGISSGALPPLLSGIGFVLITILFFYRR